MVVKESCQRTCVSCVLLLPSPLITSQNELIYQIGTCTLDGHTPWIAYFIQTARRGLRQRDFLDLDIIPDLRRSEVSDTDPTRVLESYHHDWWRIPNGTALPAGYWTRSPETHLRLYRQQVMS